MVVAAAGLLLLLLLMLVGVVWCGMTGLTVVVVV